MKKLILALIFCIYSTAAFADCIIVPVIGDGSDDGKTYNPYRPDIPPAITALKGVTWISYIPPKNPGKADGPKYPDSIVCFPDSLRLPTLPGVQKMTRDEAVREITRRDPRVPFKPDLLNVAPLRTSFQRMIDRALHIAWSFIEVANAFAATDTDDFNRADDPADIGSEWDTYNSSACVLINNTVTGNGSGRCVEGFNATLPGAAQYGKFIIAAHFTPEFHNQVDYRVMVRLQAPTTYSGYACVVSWDSGVDGQQNTFIQRRDAGSATAMGATETATTWTVGDELRCEANSDTITLKKNGVTVMSRTDSTYTTGRVGIAVLSTFDTTGAWA